MTAPQPLCDSTQLPRANLARVTLGNMRTRIRNGQPILITEYFHLSLDEDGEARVQTAREVGFTLRRVERVYAFGLWSVFLGVVVRPNSPFTQSQESFILRTWLRNPDNGACRFVTYDVRYPDTYTDENLAPLYQGKY